MKNSTAAILLTGISLAITVFFCIRMAMDGYWFWSGAILFDKTGQVGDFIGGVVGTIFSGAGFYFLYLTLNEQRTAIAKERFENKFFELIKLHRGNVSELRYSTENSQGRKVFRVIFKEFIDCLGEVQRFSQSEDANKILKPDYKSILERIVEPINKGMDLYQLVTIDIAFCIIFFGVGREGEAILEKLFSHKYDSAFSARLIHYMKLKPKQSSSEYGKWMHLNGHDFLVREEILVELFEKTNSSAMANYSDRANSCRPSGIYDKYYGGHQHRLGHYYRHLFQSYKFLNTQGFLTWEEKYFYGKTLRAQLSTYEQALLFIDSISSLGFKWEFTPDYEKAKNLSDMENIVHKQEWRLITRYHLIKNLPGENFYDIRFKDYYPNVAYESDEANLLKVSNSQPA